MKTSESFVVDVIGETTGKTWKGVFKTKLRLSHRDYLRQDEIRRQLLGANPNDASPRAQNTAELFSYISVHLLESPQWWSQSSNGLDHEDDNVIGSVYAEISKLKEKEDADLKAKAAEDIRVLEADKK